MKKLLSLCLILAVLLASITGCVEKNETKTGKLSIVSTIFPAYDFAKQISKEKADVTMLLPPGAESHSYEPSAQDIIKIQNCDLFIYVGGESDAWVDDILSSLDHPIKTVKMMDCVKTVTEEHVEGMEAEQEEGEGTKEYDEHVWTSPKNAIKITQAIGESLSKMDGENKEFYEKNTINYVKQLNQLDADFTNFFKTVQNKTIIFGDRYPLRYFSDTYGLTYYAAFPGCSTETEPSAATIAFLIDKVKKEKISTVFYIEFSNHRVADNIAEATGAKSAMFHTCHNVSKADLEQGATYLSLMQQNLTVLKEAMK